MNTMGVTCNHCDGTGHTVEWKVVSEDAETGIGTAQSEEVVCKTCNGKGWTEYAVFSVEEAKAILKHCGLDSEE